MAYVYILRCGDGTLYTGIATDIRKRLRDHVHKTAACAKYTRYRTIESLAALWEAPDMTAARRLEWALHHTDRAVKDRLIDESTALAAAFPKLAEYRYTRLSGTIQDYL